jgi:ribonuclease VapC
VIAIDTSALVALLFNEPEADRIAALLDDTETVLIGAPTALEFRMVVLGQSTRVAADAGTALIAKPPFVIVPFGEDHLAMATDAFDRFGKGRHPARLNYGDCMAYAVAALADCPLLFKGDDFRHTDVAAALD